MRPPAEVDRDRMGHVHQLVPQFVATLVVARERLSVDEAERSDDLATRVADRRGHRAGEGLNIGDGYGNASAPDLLEPSTQHGRVSYGVAGQPLEIPREIGFDKS